MTKIVYSACFGGFGLSREAVLLAREISGDPKWGGPSIIGDAYEDGTLVETEFAFCSDISRTDPTLVAVVEQLGADASGWAANLQIHDLPPGTKYRIDDYDGNESVMTIDDYKWETA